MTDQQVKSDTDTCLICDHPLVQTPDGLEALGDGNVHNFCHSIIQAQRRKAFHEQNVTKQS